MEKKAYVYILFNGGSRAAKLALIEGMNPNWEDLFDLLIV